MFFWAKTQNYPKNINDYLKIDPSIPVCYVLPKFSLTDLFVLDKHCIDWKLPRPTASIEETTEQKATYLHLGRSYTNKEKSQRVYCGQAQKIFDFANIKKTNKCIIIGETISASWAKGLLEIIN